MGVLGEAIGAGVYARSEPPGWGVYCEGDLKAAGLRQLFLCGGAAFDGDVYGVFHDASDRNVKANFSAVEPRAILRTLAALPIQTWNFKNKSKTERHLGPVAQDFHAAFGLGQDDKHISTVDADGVALAAIQGLYQIVQEKDRQLQELQVRVRQLERQVTTK